MEAESRAFAKDLIIFVYSHYNKTNGGAITYCQLFNKEMGLSIVRFHSVFSQFLDEIASVICPEVCKNEEAFNDCARTLLANYWKGYIFLELITMCSCITYVAVCAFGHQRILELGCRLIAMCFQKLQWDFYAEGGWTNFAIYCKLYAYFLEELKTKNRQ